jgi:hypothetical protein
MHDIIALWKKLLGDAPSEEQFDFWERLHTPEVVQQAILKTMGKNLALGKKMDLDYKVRFASKVMLTMTARKEAHAANKARLQEEMEKEYVLGTTKAGATRPGRVSHEQR